MLSVPFPMCYVFFTPGTCFISGYIITSYNQGYSWLYPKVLILYGAFGEALDTQNTICSSLTAAVVSPGDLSQKDWPRLCHGVGSRSTHRLPQFLFVMCLISLSMAIFESPCPPDSMVDSPSWGVWKAIGEIRISWEQQWIVERHGFCWWEAAVWEHFHFNPTQSWLWFW